jgi:hypothetical protein
MATPDIIEPPLRPRVERLLKALYTGDQRPNPSITDTSATWKPDAGEMWSTSDQRQRLTTLVLAAHKERIQVSLIADRNEPGFRVLLVRKGFAPSEPSIHHPGLSDLASQCYAAAGRQSDDQVEIARLVRLLRRAAPLVSEALMGHECNEDPSMDELPRDIHLALKAWEGKIP